jgi:superfamily I DNA/RNA helicase
MEASGKTVLAYAQLFASRREALRAVRDDAGGTELTTIHRAKGRQWPEVHLFACEEQQLPHRRALEVDAQQRAAGEGLEAERRLAYVAFTRARAALGAHDRQRPQSLPDRGWLGAGSPVRRAGAEARPLA